VVNVQRGGAVRFVLIGVTAATSTKATAAAIASRAPTKATAEAGASTASTKSYSSC
jgi:hypothetical protein